MRATEEGELEPLRIGYSNWPGWLVWEIAIEKGWFEEAGVDVEFVWMDYVPSMTAFVSGGLDGVCMTNGDALVTGATGRHSVGILINDYSSGADMIIARPGISSVRDLKGRKVALEEGYVSHMLLLKALQIHGLEAEDVQLINMPTHDTPDALLSGAADAVVTWQPFSARAAKMPGAKVLFTSAQTPGLIYDMLFAAPESVSSRPADWAKVVAVWYRVIEHLQDDAHHEEALAIMARRGGCSVEELQLLMKGTHLLTLDEALVVWREHTGLRSVYGSSARSDDWNVTFGIYEERQSVRDYFYPNFTEALDKTAERTGNVRNKMNGAASAVPSAK